MCYHIKPTDTHNKCIMRVIHANNFGLFHSYSRYKIFQRYNAYRDSVRIDFTFQLSGKLSCNLNVNVFGSKAILLDLKELFN